MTGDVDTFHQLRRLPAIEWARSTADHRQRGHGAAVAAAVAWCVLLGWTAFVGGHPIPVLSLVDLGFHELGHLLTYPFPDRITAVMGSVAQVGVPVGLAVYFGWIRHDRIATSVCLTWAATAARDVSIYIRDAPFQHLELIGGEHDWAFLLAADLDQAAPLGRAVQTLGLLFLAVALGFAVATPFLTERAHHDRAHHGVSPTDDVRPPHAKVTWTPAGDEEREIASGPPEGHH